MEVAYVGSKITRVGIPDTNLNQLTVDQLANGPALLRRSEVIDAELRKRVAASNRTITKNWMPTGRSM